MHRFGVFALFLSVSFSAFAEIEDRAEQKSIFDRSSIEKEGEDLREQFEEKLQERELHLDTQDNLLQPDVQPDEAPEFLEPSPKLHGALTGESLEVEEKPEDVGLAKIGRVNIEDSILYTNEEVTRVNIVYNAYLETVKSNEEEKPKIEGQAGDIISSILDTLEEKKRRELEAKGEIYEKDVVFKKLAAYYYLNSIIYRNSRNVTIWLNGRKMELGDERDGLKIKQAYKDKILFEWEVNETRVNIDKWKRKADLARGLSGGRIAVDTEGKIVQFTLQPNQIIDVQNMIILEGKKTAKIVQKLNDLFYDPAKPESQFSTIKETVGLENFDEESSFDTITSPDNTQVKSDEEILRELKQQGKL